MPNLGRLRDEGIWFPNAYTSNAICSPARASLLTGLLPHNHGMVDCTHAVEPYRAHFCEDNKTVSGRLKEEGYYLGYFGKWHIERTHRLEMFGFDEYVTERDLPHFPRTIRQTVTIRDKGYHDKILCGVSEEPEAETEEAYVFDKGIDFIARASQDRDRPWCLFVSTYAPHDPYVAPKALADLYPLREIALPDSFGDEMADKPGIYRRLRTVWDELTPDDCRKAIACYYACCTLVDRQIGRIVQALKDVGQHDDTIVVFLSDHGDLLGAHGLFCKGVPPFEEVYNIPLLIRWPQSQWRGRRCDTYVSMHDIAPTLLEMADCAPLERTDGESIVPYLTGAAPPETKTAFAEFHGQRFFYTQRILWKNGLKYVFNGFDEDELYDLNRDPGEMSNRIRDPAYRGSVEELARAMWDVIKRTGDYNMYDSDYFMFRFAPLGPEAAARRTAYNK